MGALPALQSVHLVGCVNLSAVFTFQVSIIVAVFEVVYGVCFLSLLLVSIVVEVAVIV